MSAIAPDQVTETANAIVDEPLADAVNFSYLRNSGIAQLKASVGEIWSNYNDSDPGVTILDQLCYALTELGYCTQFPLADVLTQADGKIHYHDQFFEPQDILTTSPITADDYRRLLLDQLPEVRVAYIEAETAAWDGQVTGRYHTHLGLQPHVPAGAADAILRRAYVLLNQRRNVGEVFLMPRQLTPQSIVLQGSVVLLPMADAGQVQMRLQQALLDYTAPLPVRSGYQQLRTQGKSADQIFNGPKMREGWICGDDALGKKCASVSLFRLASLIADIPGVDYVASLGFSPASQGDNADGGDGNGIAIAAASIAVITLGGDFSFQWQGVTLPAAMAAGNQDGGAVWGAMQSRHQAHGIEAKADPYPAMPRGRYRDIERYYSVQNTFPDQYNIGPNSLRSDAPDYSVACSRQLKGYLMGFDQLLANQFSQLAHVGDLFSFCPGKTTYPKPHQSGNAPAKVVSLKQRRLQPGAVPVAYGGIPRQRFSVTYFCQPLYDVPNVKPLLAGHDAFHYQFAGGGPAALIEAAEWDAYRQFPFNAYMLGLRRHMESEREGNARREQMLDHLMARHGDDAALYHDMIKSCLWYGSDSQSRIIAKSIWLQNFQKLSYHRARAFDWLAPATLSQPGSPPAREARRTDSRPPDGRPPDGRPPDGRPPYPTLDGEPDQHAIYAAARLHQADFARFSAFELKADIMLGLSRRLFNLADRLQALQADPGFASWLALPPGARPAYRMPDSDLSVRCGAASVAANGETVVKDQLCDGAQCLMDIVWTHNTAPDLSIYRAHAEQLRWLAGQRKGMILLEAVLLLPMSPLTDAAARDYMLTAFLLLPGYVTLVQQPSFAQFLDVLREVHWPAHVALRTTPSSFNILKAFIPAFAWWCNSQQNPAKANNFSATLAKLLTLPAIQEASHG